MLSFAALLVIVINAVVACFVFKKCFVISKKVTDFPVKFNDKEKIDEKDWYDVAIVGAGPAGATCAYFLGKLGWKTLLLEKKKFPRDKHCGDVCCKTAIEILMEMGVYQQLLKEGKIHVSDSGGMVSPGGTSFISHSKEGAVPAAIACKRILLDEAVAMAAKKIGADLKEEHPVGGAVFDTKTNLWTIRIEDTDLSYKARVLVCCDGAPSRLATQQGIVTTPPQTNCSKAYIEGGSHECKDDGVVFYNKEILPGYSALIRHPDDVLNFCCYIIPGNPNCTQENLTYWHDHMIKDDPNISQALGPNHKIETMKAASLRLGGEKLSYGRHCLVVGDAAGMIDPLTGQGIHHAMAGGKMAAYFLDEAISHGNYDREVMAVYHQQWMDKFGYDYMWSMLFCQLIFRFPILLDAVTSALQSKGDKMLLKWADIMTGRVPKLSILKPDFSVPVTYELIRLLVLKWNGKSPAEKKTE